MAAERNIVGRSRSGGQRCGDDLATAAPLHGRAAPMTPRCRLGLIVLTWLASYGVVAAGFNIARAAQGQPPSSCEEYWVFDSTTGKWIDLTSNCGPPSEHSRTDEASPS